jgi:hypothetical protein
MYEAFKILVLKPQNKRSLGYPKRTFKFNTKWSKNDVP